MLKEHLLRQGLRSKEENEAAVAARSREILLHKSKAERLASELNDERLHYQLPVPNKNKKGYSVESYNMSTRIVQSSSDCRLQTPAALSALAGRSLYKASSKRPTGSLHASK